MSIVRKTYATIKKLFNNYNNLLILSGCMCVFVCPCIYVYTFYCMAYVYSRTQQKRNDLKLSVGCVSPSYKVQ